VVNKTDGPKQDPEVFEFYGMGLGDPIAVSAAGGHGFGDLMSEIVARLPEAGSAEDLARPRPLVAVVGRPNVGKSSFVNAVLGEARHIVTEIPGTTRDSIDTLITYYGQTMTLIDTAGLRRRSKVLEAVEFYTTVRTNRALEECDVAVILLDAVDGLVAQDIHILDEAKDRGKGIILCINKWDLVEKDSKTAQKFIQELDRRLASFIFVPKMFISSLTKQRTHKALELVLRVYEERQKRIGTPELNRFIGELMESSPTPSVKGRDIRFQYVTQVAAEPPLFLFWSKHPELTPDNYRVFLEKRLREQYGFEGVPLKLAFRKKE
jgi:GTP-binding protein